MTSHVRVGQRYLYRLIVRNVNQFDYIDLGKRFDLTPRTMQDIAQGRFNKLEVLKALAERARENLEQELKSLKNQEINIENINAMHFEIGMNSGMDIFYGQSNKETTDPNKNEDRNQNKDEVK